VFFYEDGEQFLGDSEIRRDILTANLVLRAGLPWESQAELRVPYVITDEEVTTTGLAQEDRDLSGLGDIEIAFDKMLWRETSWVPQTVGSVRWKSTTGSFDPALNEGLNGTAGFNTLQGELTAVKTQDPLVFFGSLSYNMAFSGETEAGLLDPGDTFGVSLGSLLAVSPETSLRLTLGQAFFQETEQNGSEIPGSDGVGAVLEVGLASILSQSTLLDLSAGAGLTQNSPDYQIVVSLPIQTGLLSSL
jgi:hypothetical protein